MYGNWFQSLKFRPKRCSPTHLPTRSTWVRLGLKKSNAPSSPLFRPRPGVRMTLAVPHTHKRRKRDEDDYVLLIVFMHKQKIPAVSDCRVVREGWSRCRWSGMVPSLTFTLAEVDGDGNIIHKLAIGIFFESHYNRPQLSSMYCGEVIPCCRHASEPALSIV